MTRGMSRDTEYIFMFCVNGVRVYIYIFFFIEDDLQVL
jgi:hypothetical protein